MRPCILLYNYFYIHTISYELVRLLLRMRKNVAGALQLIRFASLWMFSTALSYCATPWSAWLPMISACGAVHLHPPGHSAAGGSGAVHSHCGLSVLARLGECVSGNICLGVVADNEDNAFHATIIIRAMVLMKS